MVYIRGKTKIKPFRTAKRKHIRKAAPAIVRNIVKKELNKQEEVKIYQLADSYINPPNLLQDAVHTFAPFQTIVVGTGDNQRIGSQIYINKLVLKCAYRNTLASLNGRMRVVGVWMEEEYTVSGLSAANAAVTPTQIFYAGPHLYANGMINNKLEHNVVYDKTFNLESKNTNLQSAWFTIKMNFFKKFQYETSGPFFKNKQFYILFIPSVPGVSPGINTNHTLNVQSLVTYKDS